MTMRVLRLSRPSALVTAQVFEELFERELGRVLEVRRAPLDGWCAAVLNDDPSSVGAGRRFASATRDVDFICPSYEGAALAPLFMALRNRGGSRARLLLIAHSPALLPMEWALLPPLLAPGDVVVAPSESARNAILFLSADMEPWVRVIPHPMAPLTGVSPARADRPRLLGLGRLHPAKLTHRQIEAVALLRQRGHRTLSFDIAGAGSDAYTRVLTEQIRRLGLDEHVRLVGELSGERAKAAFLSEATTLLNLSVTLEESFGKAPVEALSSGVPVVVSRWNGLPETIGSCGVAAPVSLAGQGATVDVTASAIADAIESLLASLPAAGDCVAQSEQFSPQSVRMRYGAALHAAMDATSIVSSSDTWPAAELSAAPRGGLLHSLAPLTHLSWRELFAASIESTTWIRAGWDGAAAPASQGDRLRSLLLAGSRVPLERMFGHLPPVIVPNDAPASSMARSASSRERTLGEALSDSLVAGAACAGAVLTSRVACLLELRGAGNADAAWRGLARIEEAGFRAPGLTFLRIEAIDERGDPVAALARAVDAWRAAPPDELEVHRVRQIARLARRCGRPADALPWLAEWLERFPLGPTSGAVWLDRCVAGMQGSAHGPGAAPYRGKGEEDALIALAEARLLLGNEEPAVQMATRALERGLAQLMVV